ncbi:MAG: hypothetical protein HGA19_07980 [Oscillochloris sp.]|nr:hypothetical protein [Oscillochloris sp.]
MTNSYLPQQPGPPVYRLRIGGHLPAHWPIWFNGMSARQHADGTTTLEGSVIDQAALYGLISRIRDLGLVLLTVQRIEEEG